MTAQCWVVFFTTEPVGHREVEIVSPINKEQSADEGTNSSCPNTTVLSWLCKYNNSCTKMTPYTVPEFCTRVFSARYL